GSSPKSFCEMGGKLYFSAYTDNTGQELWVTDGTDNGTSLVKDIAPGAYSSTFKSTFIVYSGKLYFVATDNTADRLWTSDGTETGTHTVTNDASIKATYTSM